MVAAVDPIPTQRAHVQTLLPEVRCYADIETLLAHEALDFLDVCTPPALHERLILQACEHGLHVLCEKPLTFTAGALQRIMAAASAADVLVFPVHNWKYAPIFQALKRLLTEGVIGTPSSVSIRRWLGVGFYSTMAGTPFISYFFSWMHGHRPSLPASKGVCSCLLGLKILSPVT
jgi:predicted dehydrogenase